MKKKTEIVLHIIVLGMLIDYWFFDYQIFYRSHFRFPNIDYHYWNCTRRQQPVCRMLRVPFQNNNDCDWWMDGWRRIYYTIHAISLLKMIWH